MKSAERIAILFLAGILMAAPAFAGDDTKADTAAKAGDSTKSGSKAGAAATRDKDTAAEATTDSTTPSDSNAVPATTSAPASTPVAAPSPVAIDPNAGAPAPMPKGAVASGSYQEAAAYNASIKWNPMPALDGNPGLFTLELGDILPKHAWNVGVGVNKFSE